MFLQTDYGGNATERGTKRLETELSGSLFHGLRGAKEALSECVLFTWHNHIKDEAPNSPETA